LRHTVAELTDPAWASVRCAYDEDARWFVLYRGSLAATVAVVCNLGPERQAVPVGWPAGGGPGDQAGGHVPSEPGWMVVDPLAVSRPGFTFQPGRVETDGESVVIARLLPRRLPA
ncbi:unnamed protein product, partial [marine sediment metagenome]